MKNYFYIFIILTILLLVFASCSTNESKTDDIPEQVISVKAKIVSAKSIKLTNSYTGSLKGEQQADIYAKIPEAVDKVLVKEGDFVKANDVIISLDETGASSNLLQAKSLFENAEKNFRKMEYLYKEGAVSEIIFDASRTEYEVSKATYEAAEKLVNVESPISGLVTSLAVRKGDFVQIGQKMATIAKCDNMRIIFNVNSSELNSFSIGSEIEIETDGGNNKSIGKVVSIASSADPTNRAFEVEAIAANNENIFKPEMFVRISFIKQTIEDVIVIPRKSILTLDNQETVYVIQNGKAFGKSVVLGPETEGMIVVESGLSIGDTLVTLGQDYLKNNSSVNISEVE